MTIIDRFGDILEEVIEQKGLSNAKVAKAVKTYTTAIDRHRRKEVSKADPELIAAFCVKYGVNIYWVMQGEGQRFAGQEVKPETPSPDNVVDLEHQSVIREFDDKEYALELNKALVTIEKTSLKEYYDLGGYIKGIAEKAGGWMPDRRRGKERRVNDEPYGEKERRSGQDRRKKAVGE